MERLLSSRHLVPIYGYYVNNVLTQVISHTLGDIIFARENERAKSYLLMEVTKQSLPLSHGWTKMKMENYWLQYRARLA